MSKTNNWDYDEKYLKFRIPSINELHKFLKMIDKGEHAKDGNQFRNCFN